MLQFFRFHRLYRAMSASVVEAFCLLLKAILHILCAPFVLELTRLGIKMEAIIARDGHLRGASKWLVEIAARPTAPCGSAFVICGGQIAADLSARQP